MYAIVDIETTGGEGRNHRITEVAIVVFDGEKEVRRFESLINPETFIPQFITQLTGITNDMVRNAPRFFEVAKDIILTLEGTTFVAHNVSFDYSLIKSEYERLSYPFNMKRLCTVKMSRKIFPGLKGYGLGKLCEHFGIENKARHRAMGDAEATLELFKLLLENNQEGKVSDSRHDRVSIPPLLDPKLVDELPTGTGVYYYYDREGELIYVGKAKNIRQRALSHFRNIQANKAIEMNQRIADIKYKVTGSELVALLLESDEIKKHRPFYNRAQKRVNFNWGLFSDFTEEGYRSFKVERMKDGRIPLTTFTNKESGRSFLYKMTEKHDLCQSFNGLYKTNGGCLLHDMGKCRGACVGEEEVDEYNKRAISAEQLFAQVQDNAIIVDEGRTEHERSVILVEDGKYKGFGYTDVYNINFGASTIKKNIEFFKDNKDVQTILQGYLKRNKVQQIIPL